MFGSVRRCGSHTASSWRLCQEPQSVSSRFHHIQGKRLRAVMERRLPWSFMKISPFSLTGTAHVRHVNTVLHRIYTALARRLVSHSASPRLFLVMALPVSVPCQ